jgi:hypothetical protein
MITWTAEPCCRRQLDVVEGTNPLSFIMFLQLTNKQPPRYYIDLATPRIVRAVEEKAYDRG